jgi:tryptophan synthase beta subunit
VIYEFKEPKQFVAAWTKDDSKKQLKDFIQLISTDQDSPNLILRQGCTMYLKKKGKVFEGSTKGNNCVSNLRGAVYATSTAVITEKGMVTLDRGYDASGKQVWGSEHGGYKFIRQ